MIKQFVLLMLVLAVGSSADDRLAHNEIRLLSPENGTTIYVPHPHLRWQKEAGADIEDRYRVQISRDEAFHALVVDDSLDVVSRLVCPKPLPTGSLLLGQDGGAGRLGASSSCPSFLLSSI